MLCLTLKKVRMAVIAVVNSMAATQTHIFFVQLSQSIQAASLMDMLKIEEGLLETSISSGFRME